MCANMRSHTPPHILTHFVEPNIAMKMITLGQNVENVQQSILFFYTDPLPSPESRRQLLWGGGGGGWARGRGDCTGWEWE